MGVHKKSLLDRVHHRVLSVFLGQYQRYNNITINYERSINFAAISYSKNADIA